MQNFQIKIWIILFLAIALYGCASSPSAPVASDSVENTELEELPEGNIGVSREPLEQIPQRPVVARELPENAETAQSKELPAMTYLLNQAQTALDNNDLDRASALADRALQIDRKSARAYLMLALVEVAKGKPDLASQLARQGLLYTSESSPEGKQLLVLIK